VHGFFANTKAGSSIRAVRAPDTSQGRHARELTSHRDRDHDVTELPSYQTTCNPSLPFSYVHDKFGSKRRIARRRRGLSDRHERRWSRELRRIARSASVFHVRFRVGIGKARILPLVGERMSSLNVRRFFGGYRATGSTKVLNLCAVCQLTLDKNGSPLFQLLVSRSACVQRMKIC